MNEEQQNQQVPDPVQTSNEVELSAEFRDLKSDRAYQEMMKLFEEMTFFQRMGRMFSGLGKPKDSGDYKFARLQAQRLMAPLIAVLVPVLVIAVLTLYEVSGVGAVKAVEVQMIDLTPPENLDEIEPPPEDDISPDDFIELDFTLDFDTPVTIETPSAIVTPMAVNANPPVTMVKSPITMPGMQTRSGEARVKALRTHGGDKGEQDAVMKALRWLATKQEADGSWPVNKTAMTGLALLTFLAHGETPSSEEFGEVVEKGIRFLVSNQQPNGLFKVSDGHGYSHPIAAYALCEAYSMTRVPMLKEAAEKAMVPILKGHQPSGGWDYNMALTQRADTSYMGWCAQAVKAAHMAGFVISGPGYDLETSYKKVAPGMLQNYLKGPNGGGFGYTGPAIAGLTSVGTLALQLTGYADSDEVKACLLTMDNWKPFLVLPEGAKQPTTPGGSPQYYLYYATQCMFHFGGTRWQKWNAQMIPEYTKTQKQMSSSTSGYKDHEGKPQAIGWWENADASSDRPVMDTCLTTLQLTVYYRYLPTFAFSAETVNEVIDTSQDVTIDIKL